MFFEISLKNIFTKNFFAIFSLFVFGRMRAGFIVREILISGGAVFLFLKPVLKAKKQSTTYNVTTQTFRRA